MLLEQLSLSGGLAGVSALDDEGLEVRRVTGWSSSRWLGRLSAVTEEAGNALGVGDDGEQAHAPAATRASFDVDREGLSQQLRPRTVARAGRAVFVACHHPHWGNRSAQRTAIKQRPHQETHVGADNDERARGTSPRREGGDFRSR